MASFRIGRRTRTRKVTVKSKADSSTQPIHFVANPLFIIQSQNEKTTKRSERERRNFERCNVYLILRRMMNKKRRDEHNKKEKMAECMNDKTEQHRALREALNPRLR